MISFELNERRIICLDNDLKLFFPSSSYQQKERTSFLLSLMLKSLSQSIEH